MPDEKASNINNIVDKLLPIEECERDDTKTRTITRNSKDIIM